MPLPTFHLSPSSPKLGLGNFLISTVNFIETIMISLQRLEPEDPSFMTPKKQFIRAGAIQTSGKGPKNKSRRKAGNCSSHRLIRQRISGKELKCAQAYLLWLLQKVWLFSGLNFKKLRKLRELMENQWLELKLLHFSELPQGCQIKKVVYLLI